MNLIAEERTRKKTLFAFFVALSLLLASGRNGFPFEEPTAKDSPSAADDFNAVSGEIQHTIKELGYSDDTDIFLVQMVNGWKYMDWKQMLSRARQDHQQKKASADQVAQVEEDVLKELYGAIRHEFSPAADDSEYFYLSKAVKDKTAQSLGFSQLLYVLGNSIGLTVKVADVLEPATGFLPTGEEHTACLVELTGGKAIMVDFIQDTVSKAFVFQEQFSAVGNCWELKQKDNPLKIHRRIQILDRNGLAADIYYNLGNAYAKSGKDAEAISFLTKAAELNPKFAKAYSSRGVEFLKKGQNTKAVADLDKAVQLDPKHAEAYYNLGIVYFGLGQNAKAVSSLSKAIELKPIFSGAYKTRGTIFYKLGQNAEAMADFTKAAELDPKDAEARLGLGTMYTQSKQYDKAISIITKAIEIDPKSAEAYNGRGVAYSKLSKYTDAIADYMKSIELNPKFADAHFNRGLVYSELGENLNAITYFTKTIELNPKGLGAYFNRGMIYVKLGRYNEAIADFNKAIEFNPKFAQAYYQRGLANAGLNKNEKAKKDLQRAAELNPAIKEQVKKIMDKLK